MVRFALLTLSTDGLQESVRDQSVRNTGPNMLFERAVGRRPTNRLFKWMYIVVYNAIASRPSVTVTGDAGQPNSLARLSPSFLDSRKRFESGRFHLPALTDSPTQLKAKPQIDNRQPTTDRRPEPARPPGSVQAVPVRRGCRSAAHTTGNKTWRTKTLQ